MGLNILVAEDSVAYAVLYQQIFESRGHTVQLTFDGEECMSAYMKKAAEKSNSQNPYNMVILDHSMPKKTGFEVAKAIHQTNPNQKMLIITSFEDELSSKLKEDGMHNYVEVIEKPFNSSILINKIEQEANQEKTNHILLR
jgi:CheY-like chemotaxis protein